MSLRLVVATAFVCLLAACGGKQAGDTLVLLELTSDTAGIEELEVFVRNVGYQEDRFYVALDAGALTKSPYVLALRPPASFGGEVLARARGYVGGLPVVSGAKQLAFSAGRSARHTLVLTASALRDDADGDGFVEGLGEGTDCDDRNAEINPFTAEQCGDEVDNDCSGYPPDEGCACVRDVPCTTLPVEALALAGVGVCKNGVLKCTNGTLASVCTGGFTFTSTNQLIEVPNDFLDNDCDGAVDEGSSCSATSQPTRPCFLGWVDDPSNPATSDPDFASSDIPAGMTSKQQASLRARGECGNLNTNGTRTAKGTQRCGSDGTWSATCDGEVRPQRPPGPGQSTASRASGSAFTGVGYVELRELGQCDGKDNDCDGAYDEDGFDSDGDFFTTCGTRFRTVSDGAGGSKAVYDQPGLADEFLDCNDATREVNPATAERCDNTRDDDCRCDHATTAASANTLGQYRLHVTAATGERPPPSCTETAAALDCTQAGPRSPDYASGRCSDDTDAAHPPYYAGYAFDLAGLRTCYFCAASFGFTCDPATHTCDVKAASCSPCPLPPSRQESDVAARRPPCHAEVDGSCSAARGPEWAPRTAGADDNNECGAVSCDAHFAGSQSGRCYRPVNPTDTQVGCSGKPLCSLASGADCCDPAIPSTCCQSAAEVCATMPARSTPEVRTAGLCKELTAGCVGSDAPVYGADVARGTDPYEDCAGATTCCVGACCKQAGEGCGVANDCEPGLDCVGSICKRPDGASCEKNGECEGGSCECDDAECSTRRCASVSCTCTYLNGPGTACSGGDLAVDTDPNDDCPGASCDGSGACRSGTGVDCTATGDAGCESGKCECQNATCTTRVCSDTDCVCRTTTDGFGVCDGLVQQHARDTLNCAANQSCSGGACKLATGETCAASAECSSALCECANDTCSSRVCSQINCSCRYTSDGLGTCDGSVQSGESDTLNCTGGRVCDGLGGCKIPLGGDCTNQGDVACVGVSYCECKDATCSSSICVPNMCFCMYDGDFNGTCDGPLEVEVDDPNSCNGTKSCDGSSNGPVACKSAVGQSCNNDNDCATDNCTGGPKKCAP